MTASPAQRYADRASLGQLAAVFARLGSFSFGGPAAHTALMHDEMVRRRGWLTEQEFLDLVAATNLIPGPNSTEMAIHIGYKRAGWPGLLVAGACFVAPATLMVAGLAWAYVRFGTLPAAQGMLQGIAPVVIAIIAQALWGLARTAVKSPWLGLLGLAAAAAVAWGVSEIAVLAAGGAVAGLTHALARRGRGPWSPGCVALVSLPETGARLAAGSARAAGMVAVGAATAGAAPLALGTLFGVFLKAGALLFGSGYVLLAFLRADLVSRLGWLTERQLLDAIAVGQMTPGPLFTTATFIGYVLGGGIGAVVATLGIFLPAFVYVAVSAPFIPGLRRSALAGAVLDGVTVVSLALMGLVTWQLGRASLVDPLTLAVAAIAAVLLLATRLNSAWLIVGGAIVGAIAMG